jgi:hypothetical protein
VQGARSGAELSEFLKLPFPLLDDLLIDLQQRRYVEVRGTRGVNRASYVFDLTGDAGRGRAARVDGPRASTWGRLRCRSPEYRHWSHLQSIRHARVTRREVEEGFSWMVLPQETLDEIGPSLNSGKSLFLYGDAGNGKTAIAETMARLIPGTMCRAVRDRGGRAQSSSPTTRLSSPRRRRGPDEHDLAGGEPVQQRDPPSIRVSSRCTGRWC